MAIKEITISMVDDGVYAKQAGQDDVNEVKALTLETAKWLNRKGLDQWNGLLHGKDKHNITGAIARGEVFTFRNVADNGLVGAVILQQSPSEWDKKLWGEDDAHHSTAIYIHRLVTDRSLSNKGLGRKIMMWIENGIVYTGKNRIKLDCVSNNEKLNRFYLECGYTYMGEADGFNKYQKTLY
ncbi:GNAT family N-acetyltransferase [Gorillibacterium massiliense]|uniref:GNAT family N-acetyltransferase n=1 Tax=Gorillibacterium massiliense TaxID=1280390 RepID=UPI000693E43D|nr:GNAT family N-acetyltransferase [Gorillibacterium massiliense]